ncbi:hypothetical protein K402DRAFT_425854 [Aulographum hederae CBS 113979]|uniref:Zn(2)-C6 fungal-type domain-containing protein n=1 Tax=Aulographum hederae CBS 113979 TaxID=1176131 RepID=A0A6G1GIX9_9PEZI|nr:hypothetical protein K402DRAFT_425854 [Aulographum hederae CBS 113979]
MSRPLLPYLGSHPHGRDGMHTSASPPEPPAGGPSKPSYSKRGKITIVACVQCRKRKSKCDGKRPVCSGCQSRDSICHYDMSEDQRRLTFVRDNVEQLAEEKTHLESLIATIQTSNETDATEIWRRLRSGTDAPILAQQVHAGRILADVRFEEQQAPGIRPPSRIEQYQRIISAIRLSSNPSEIHEIVRRIQQNETVAAILQAVNAGNLVQPLASASPENQTGTPGPESDYSSHLQRFGLVKGTGEQFESGAPDAHTPPTYQPWTTVSDDPDFIEHLMSLYFSWQHSFFQCFPEKLFRENMANNQTQYCSRLLVNAVCAAGCLLSPRPEARLVLNDPRSAGWGFFHEAVCILNETTLSSIPTTAALYVLCHVEGELGRMNAVWDFTGRSGRMAVDLNLHLSADQPTTQSRLENTTAKKARCLVFWGVFIADQVTSFTLGRLPQILVNAITVDLPPIIVEEDSEDWIGYDNVHPVRPSIKSTTFHELAALSKIVNSTLQMFFAPTRILSGRSLLEEHDKYLAWFSKLPAKLANTDVAPPHVLCLHMYYNAAVLLLFRPFLKAEFTQSDISPRVKCREAAKAISDILGRHRRLYGLSGFYTFQLHCILTACTIHIINLPTIAATTRLTDACNHFQDLVHRNAWAGHSLDTLRGLVDRWKIILPSEVETALYRNFRDASSQDPNMVYPPTDHFSPILPVPSGSFPTGVILQTDPSSSSSAALLARPEKRGPTNSFTHNPPSSSSSFSTAPLSPKRPRLYPPPSSTLNPAAANAPPNPPSSTTPTANPQPHYLFAPFPNQPAPLLGPIHTSTSADTEWNDELARIAQGFDGLDFGVGDEEGLLDPFMGWGG